jgi:hypothetical protein
MRIDAFSYPLICHPGESRDPEVQARRAIFKKQRPENWVPAFAGMTENI